MLYFLRFPKHRRLFFIAFILTTCCIQAAQAQIGSKRVTLRERNISIESIFKSITKQTGLYFMGDASELNVKEKLNVAYVSKSVEEILKELLLPRGFTWSYNDNVVRITREKKISMDNRDTIPLITIEGSVTDAAGAPLVGASVLVRGTTKGCLTDEEGRFRLKGITDKTPVMASMIGYESITEAPNGRLFLRYKLRQSMNILDEAVVIGYGSTTKRFNTGSVSTVKAEDIQKSPVSNPMLAVQGRIPGIDITQSTGMPGGGIKVQIRGQSSITGGNDPLYVIDGVPYSSNMSLTGSAGNLIGEGSPLNYINPADIESIDVLKDADATAIYGSRGANGVILITTKKGKEGKTKLNINAYSGIGKVTKKLNLLNTQQYLAMRREAYKNDGVNPDMVSAPDLLAWDTTSYTDWQKLLIGNTAHQTDVQMSVTGGSKLIQFLVGGGYRKETTVFPSNAANNRKMFRFNVNSASPNHKFKVSLSGNYLSDNSNLPGSDLTYNITLPPNTPSIYNNDGTLNWGATPTIKTTFQNPFSIFLQKFKMQTNNLLANITLTYQLLPNLEIKAQAGYNTLNTKTVSTYPYTAISPIYIDYGAQRSASYTDNSITIWNIEPQINYDVQLGKGRLGVLLGLTFQQQASKDQTINALGFTNDAVLENIRAASSVNVSNATDAVYRYASIFSRINYRLLDKYIISASVRRDGSSRFGPGKRFANFAAIGAGWLFSEENFLKRNNIITFGKLRASYGTSGNDKIGDYKFYDTYNTSEYPYQNIKGLIPDNLFNPDFAWEVTKKLEFALELGVIQNRILLTTAYYRNRSSNLLLANSIPSITGFTTRTSNLNGIVQNSGIELTINTKNINTKNFSWSTSLNISVPKNKLVAYPGLETSVDKSRYVIGQPISIRKLYHFYDVDPATGIYRFIDSKGIPSSDISTITEQTGILNSNPRYFGGIQNTFQLKNFQLDFLFQFRTQQAKDYLFDYIPGAQLNQPSAVMERWQKKGDNKPFQRFSQNSSLYTAYNASLNSDQNVIDASFIRLKNVSISYNLSGAFLKKIRAESARIYLQGQNLLTITKYHGLDPETLSTRTLPPLMVLTAGLNITL